MLIYIIATERTNFYENYQILDKSELRQKFWKKDKQEILKNTSSNLTYYLKIYLQQILTNEASFIYPTFDMLAVVSRIHVFLTMSATKFDFNNNIIIKI